MKRFWDKVQITDNNDDCWLWTGAKDLCGYGRFKIEGKVHGSNRLSLEWKLGRPLEEGMLACHTCNVPSCCNPNHLYEGTRSQNTLDSIAAGTYKQNYYKVKVRRRGENNPSSKLTENDVARIRQLLDGNMSMRAIGRKFNVHHNVISKIKTGKNWNN